MKAKITAILETSDHDGYCSGGECEYESNKVVKIVDIPPNLSVCNLSKLNFNEWVHLLPHPTLNNGSGYCDINSEVVKNGLYKHDFRYTITKIEFVNDDEIPIGPNRLTLDECKNIYTNALQQYDQNIKMLCESCIDNIIEPTIRKELRKRCTVITFNIWELFEFDNYTPEEKVLVKYIKDYYSWCNITEENRKLTFKFDFE